MLRIHLKEDARPCIQEGKLEGYKIKYDQDGTPYVEQDSLSMSLTTPERLKPYIRDISGVSHFPASAHRIMGVYETGTTTAYVNLKARDEYSLFMVGQSVEGMLEMYRRIRSGKLRPTESWEAEQIQEPPVPAKEE